MSIARSLLKPILDFALPSRCPICGIIVTQNHEFCPACWQNLDFLNEPWCVSCGKPFAFEHQKDSMCVECLAKKPEHDGVRAVVAYDGNSALLVKRLKYNVRLGLADLVAQHLVRFANKSSSDALIIPVPLHRWRLWSRGFNQSVLIARALSRLTGQRLELNIIQRKQATPPLHSQSKKQRQKIMRNAFYLSKDNARLIEGRTILLIDDVYTSGSTSSACAKLLKSGGARKVLVLCWARVILDDERV